MSSDKFAQSKLKVEIFLADHLILVLCHEYLVRRTFIERAWSFCSLCSSFLNCCWSSKLNFNSSRSMMIVIVHLIRLPIGRRLFVDPTDDGTVFFLLPFLPSLLPSFLPSFLFLVAEEARVDTIPEICDSDSSMTPEKRGFRVSTATPTPEISIVKYKDFGI